MGIPDVDTHYKHTFPLSLISSTDESFVRYAHLLVTAMETGAELVRAGAEGCPADSPTPRWTTPNATTTVCHTYLCALNTPAVVPVFRTFHQPSIPLRKTNICYEAAMLEVSRSVAITNTLALSYYLYFLRPNMTLPWLLRSETFL